MLRKLLKYDFKAAFKYWWIAAVSSLTLCIAGGVCVNILQLERELPYAVYSLAQWIIGLTMFGLFAFLILSMLLVFVRFYKNFFTDEGYLTFTLPVKRSCLLNSKLIMSVTTLITTIIALAVNVVIALLIGYSEQIFTKEFWDMVNTVCKELINELGFYTLIYAVEFIIISILLAVFSTLFLFCCITVASVITRKARVITAIGIYYGANYVCSFVLQIFMLFGTMGIINRINAVPGSSRYMLLSFVFLGIIVLLAVFCGMLYTLEYWMLDRKLNLT